MFYVFGWKKQRNVDKIDKIKSSNIFLLNLNYFKFKNIYGGDSGATSIIVRCLLRGNTGACRECTNLQNVQKE